MTIKLDGLSVAYCFPKSFKLIKNEGKKEILLKLLKANLDADTNYWAKNELKKVE